jgi:hypothetical protein
MENSIRKIIKDKLNYIYINLNTLTQRELSKELVELSALFGGLGENIVQFDIAFANKQLEIWQTNEEMTAKEMEIRAKTTEEYKNFMIAKFYEKAIIEVTRSIKFRLRILANELELSKNL